jgi:spore coat protein U-like protein
MKHMKQIILAAALAALGGTASAGSSSTTINVGGEIGSSCTIAADQLNLGQKTSFELAQDISVTLGLTVNCSAGTPYTIYGANVAAIQNNTRIGLDTQSGRSNGQRLSSGVTGTGTGAEQQYTVTNALLNVYSLNNPMGIAEPTGGVVNAVLVGAFTLSY